MVETLNRLIEILERDYPGIGDRSNRQTMITQLAANSGSRGEFNSIYQATLTAEANPPLTDAQQTALDNIRRVAESTKTLVYLRTNISGHGQATVVSLVREVNEGTLDITSSKIQNDLRTLFQNQLATLSSTSPERAAYDQALKRINEASAKTAKEAAEREKNQKEKAEKEGAGLQAQAGARQGQEGSFGGPLEAGAGPGQVAQREFRQGVNADMDLVLNIQDVSPSRQSTGISQQEYIGLLRSIGAETRDFIQEGTELPHYHVAAAREAARLVMSGDLDYNTTQALTGMANAGAPDYLEQLRQEAAPVAGGQKGQGAGQGQQGQNDLAMNEQDVTTHIATLQRKGLTTDRPSETTVTVSPVSLATASKRAPSVIGKLNPQGGGLG